MARANICGLNSLLLAAARACITTVVYCTCVAALIPALLPQLMMMLVCYTDNQARSSLHSSPAQESIGLE
jgi:hypothetical protein